MKMKIVGISPVDFQSKDGNRIKRNTLYVIYPDEKINGYRSDKLFVKDSIDLPPIKPNDEVNIYFNQRGRVEAVTK